MLEFKSNSLLPCYVFDYPAPPPTTLFSCLIEGASSQENEIMKATVQDTAVSREEHYFC